MKHLTIDMPIVSECLANECAYNVNMKCHARAITVGNSLHAGCDTYFARSGHTKAAERLEQLHVLEPDDRGLRQPTDLADRDEHARHERRAVDRVVANRQGLPHVALARHYKYMCSDPGQELIVRDIKENNLTRVVVAACSPRMHEPTFRRALANAGLNPYLFEMANIRDQCSWVHSDHPDQATEKAVDLVRMAVGREV